MIKVGDTVKLVNTNIEVCEPVIIALSKHIGEIGKVIECKDDNYLVRFENNIEWCLDISEIEKGHLEWIKDED